MSANAKYIIIGTAALVVVAAGVMFKSTNEPNLATEPAVQTAGQIDPSFLSTESAGQIDPSLPDVPPAPLGQSDDDPVGPEEFYFSLASALSAEGFTEEYIQAVVQLYGGFDPRDFVLLEPVALAGQLSQHMQDDSGFQNVSTDDAQDIVTIAQEVFADLQ